MHIIPNLYSNADDSHLSCNCMILRVK